MQVSLSLCMFFKLFHRLFRICFLIVAVSYFDLSVLIFSTIIITIIILGACLYRNVKEKEMVWICPDGEGGRIWEEFGEGKS